MNNLIKSDFRPKILVRNYHFVLPNESKRQHGSKNDHKIIFIILVIFSTSVIWAVSIFSAAENGFYEDPNLVTKIRIKKTISAPISVIEFRLEHEKTQLKHLGNDLKSK